MKKILMIFCHNYFLLTIIKSAINKSEQDVK